MSDGPIILFDAECVLCSANAKFILRNDRHARFRLASMQSELGAALYRAHGIDPADPDSMIVVDGDRARRDSDAVLSIYEGLGFPWNVFFLLPAHPAVRSRSRLSADRSEPLPTVRQAFVLLGCTARIPQPHLVRKNWIAAE